MVALSKATVRILSFRVRRQMSCDKTSARTRSYELQLDADTLFHYTKTFLDRTAHTLRAPRLKKNSLSVTYICTSSVAIEMASGAEASRQFSCNRYITQLLILTTYERQVKTTTILLIF